MDRTFSQVSSRKNSHNSLHSVPASSASSNQNSDDDDSDTISMAVTYKERRREAHTQAEQKRRDAIRRGYDELQTLVCPPMNDPTGLRQTKVSKATVLQKSISQIEKLTKQKEAQMKELDRLRKEVMALKIMKANYEHILKANQNAGQSSESQLPDELKFQVFQQMMDQLFLSFNAYTSTNTFAELSACVISWLEEHCKPQSLRELLHKTMSVTLTQYQMQRDQQRKSAACVAQQHRQSHQEKQQQPQQQQSQEQSQQKQQPQHSPLTPTTLANTTALSRPNVGQSSLISSTRSVSLSASVSSEQSRSALLQTMPQLIHHLTNHSEASAATAATNSQPCSAMPHEEQQRQQLEAMLSSVTSSLPNSRFVL